MPQISRRDMCLLLPMLSVLADPISIAAQPGRTEPATVPGPGTIGSARVFPFEKLEERKTATGASWAIAHGTLATGETVNLHESMQVAGAPPVQLHVIQHSEFILVSEGEVEYKHELNCDVVTERATAGSVLYIPTGTRHAVRNVGSGPARYFVVGIGGDAK